MSYLHGPPELGNSGVVIPPRDVNQKKEEKILLYQSIAKIVVGGLFVLSASTAVGLKLFAGAILITPPFAFWAVASVVAAIGICLLYKAVRDLRRLKDLQAQAVNKEDIFSLKPAPADYTENLHDGTWLTESKTPKA